MKKQELELVAEFVGRRGKEKKNLFTFIGASVLLDGDTWYTIEQAKFHEDWNWLMPVVEKIEKMCLHKKGANPKGYSISVMIDGDYCRIQTNAATVNDPCYFARIVTDKSKIQCVFEAVCQFIEWYNKNKADESK